MVKYSTALNTALNNALDKRAWCAVLIQTLGNNLTFTCKRDPNTNAVNPWVSGTTFYSGSLRGVMRTRGDSVVNFGNTYNVTTKNAVNLSSGKSVLRIEGNGQWIEFTLGLITSSCDIRFKRNPTTKTGLSISNISLAAKASLPFGIGPTAPAITANTTVTAVIEDMQIPAFPKVVGNLHLDQERDSIVFEDLEMATQFGDVRVTQTKNTVIYGQFEFGITRFDMNEILNSEANVPLEQGLIYCKPYGVWPTYPLMDTWNAARDLTYPKAFRVRLIRGDGSTWKTLQMRDGLPINSPELAQTWWGGAKPLRPHWNCGMMLPWQSHLPKHSDLLAKYFNGMESDSIRPSQAKEGASVNAAIPLASGSGQVNGQLQYNAAPQWPLRYDAVWGGSADVNAQDTFDDPYLYDVKTWHSDEGRRHGISGWDYEPGSLSGHDDLAYKGGPRMDRSIVNHALAMFASDPTSRRLKGDVPWRTLLNAYGMAMFNRAHHWVTDVKTCSTLSKELVMGGKLGTYGTRYAGRVSDIEGAETRSVWMHGIADGASWPEPKERGGHDNHWGGFQQDHLHNSLAPGLMAIMLNSIMHIVSQKMRFTGSLMAQTAVNHPVGVRATDYYMTRNHAFRWFQYAVQWKLGTKHSLGGYTQEDVLSMFQKDLERVHDDIVVPTVANDQNEYFKGLRLFGIPGTREQGGVPRIGPDGQVVKDQWGYTVNDPTLYWGMTHDTKVFYLAQTMVLMRQFGLWKVLRDRSTKCRLALDFTLECLDRFSIDAFYHTGGRAALYGKALGPETLKLPEPQVTVIPDMVNGWAAWGTTLYPRQGLEDLLTDVNGNPDSSPMGDQAATTHLRQQYILMRSIYFPEYPHPLLADTEIMVRAQYKKFDDYIKAMPNKRDQSMKDFVTRWAPHGILKPPSILEPI